VLPATRKAALALSALSRAAAARRRMAVVRFALQANAAVSLGVLVPQPAQHEADLDSFLMFKVPWGNEYQALNLPEHDDLAVRALLACFCCVLLSLLIWLRAGQHGCWAAVRGRVLCATAAWSQCGWFRLEC
jgi:Ku70/Ku80 beta-barrel domain